MVTTERARYQSIERQSGNPHPALEPIWYPEEGEHLRGWFAELDAARSSGAYGRNPLSFAEIQAWAALTRRNVSPFEVGVLRRIDAVFLAVMNEPDEV